MDLTKQQKQTIALCLLAFLLGWLVHYKLFNYEKSNVCQWTTQDGRNITGECNSLYTQYKPQDPYIVQTISPKDMEYQQPIEVKLKTTTSSTTTTQCPLPVCLKCDNPLTATQIKDLKNIKPGPNGNPAISEGYSQCKKDVLEILKLKNKTPDHIIRPNIVKPEIDDNRICFVSTDGLSFWINRTPDQNNRPRWNWEDSECLKSALKVYKTS